MPRATTCLYLGDEIDVGRALEFKEAAARDGHSLPSFFCTFCDGPVGPWSGQSAHMEHGDRNPRCPLSDPAPVSAVRRRGVDAGWGDAFDALKVFLEASRGGKYLKLHPQNHNQMLLYGPGHSTHPLHIVEPSRMTRVDVFDALGGIIRQKSPGKDSAGFVRYGVDDWEMFAQVIQSFAELEAIDVHKVEHANGRNLKSTRPLDKRGAIQRMIDVAYVTANASGKPIFKVTKDKKLGFPTSSAFLIYVEQLIAGNDGRCALTGLPLSFDVNRPDKEFLCSLDRIDSNGHYVEGNLQVVCRFVNRWKGSQNDEEFRRLLLRLREGG